MRRLLVSILILTAAACGGRPEPAAPGASTAVSRSPLATTVPTERPTATPGPEPFLVNNLTEPEIGAFSLVGHTQGITAIWLTPDDQRAVTHSADGTLRVWDLRTSKPVLTFCAVPGHTCDFEILDVSSDASRAIAASELEAGYLFRLLDLSSGQQLAAFQVQGYDQTMGVSLTPSGDGFITVSSLTSQIAFYNAESGAELRTLKPAGAGVSAVALTPGGRQLILAPWRAGGQVGGLDFNSYLAAAISYGLDEPQGGELQIWDVETGEMLRSLQGHTAAVLDIRVTDDGRRAFTSALDGTVRAWDLTQGTELYSIPAQRSPFSTGIHLSPSETLAVLSVGDAQSGVLALQVHETAGGAWVSTLELDEGAADLQMPWAFPINDQRAIGATAASELVVWDLNTGRVLLRHDGGFAPDALAITSDGARAITGDRFNELHVIDLASLEVLSTLHHAHTGAVTGLALMPDGRRVLTGSEDRSVRMWALASGTELASFPIQGRAIAVAVSADGRQAVVSAEHHLEIWDLVSESLILSIAGESGYLLTFTADGQRILVGNEWEGTVKLLNAHTGKVERVFYDPPRVSFTDPPRLKGMHLLSGEGNLLMVYDGGGSVFELESGERLDGYRGGENAVAFEAISAVSPDGNRWAWSLFNSFTRVGRTNVYDFELDVRVFGTAESLEQMRSLAFSPDGTRLLGTSGRTVTLWDVDTGEELFTYEIAPTAGSVRQIAITPDGQRALLLSGTGLFSTGEAFALITLLDLSAWITPAQ